MSSWSQSLVFVQIASEGNTTRLTTKFQKQGIMQLVQVNSFHFTIWFWIFVTGGVITVRNKGRHWHDRTRVSQLVSNLILCLRLHYRQWDIVFVFWVNVNRRTPIGEKRSNVFQWHFSFRFETRSLFCIARGMVDIVGRTALIIFQRRSDWSHWKRGSEADKRRWLGDRFFSFLVGFRSWLLWECFHYRCHFQLWSLLWLTLSAFLCFWTICLQCFWKISPSFARLAIQ